MFDILAIDWGSKRFGLAFGSSSSGLVIPCQYECNTVDIWTIVHKEITIRKPMYIIIGKPTTFDLKPTQVSDNIDSFINEFKKKYLESEPIIINERESTKNALLKNREVTKHELNHNAACEILNIWLSERHKDLSK